VISAFIKSIRGSDVDAALHYLARMIEAGEDPRFISRRVMISAAEDIGIADPQALLDRVSCPGRHLGSVHGRGDAMTSGRFNQRWSEFIEGNPNVTAKEIYQYGGRLMGEYGLSKLPIIPYR